MPSHQGKHENECLSDGKCLAIADDTRDAQADQPAGDPFASWPLHIQIVIAGADEDLRRLRQPAQILRSYDNLGVLWDNGANLPADPRRSPPRRDPQQPINPVELLQRVVQVGDQQEVHEWSMQIRESVG